MPVKHRPAQHMFNSDLTEATLSTETVFRGRLFDVRLDRVRLPNGRESTREYLVHPGAAVIIPLFDNGDVLLERQYRYPLRRDFIELPAGKLDPGEEALACAKRELKEETGYTADEWHSLAAFYPCIGYSNERLVFYLARHLRHVGASPDHDECLQILRVPLAQALEMIRDGRICEGKTVMGLLWLERFWLGKR